MISTLRYDRKYRYILMFPQTNSSQPALIKVTWSFNVLFSEIYKSPYKVLFLCIPTTDKNLPLIMNLFQYFRQDNISGFNQSKFFYLRDFQHGVFFISLTHWPLGDLKIFFKMSFSNSYPESIPWAIPAKLLSEVCHRTPLMISQHWFR